MLYAIRYIYKMIWLFFFLICQVLSRTFGAIILDGHATNTKNVAIIENETTVLFYLPTHKLKPLVVFLWPLLRLIIWACVKLLRKNPGNIISQFQISKLLGGAFLCTAAPAGIFPEDPWCWFRSFRCIWHFIELPIQWFQCS